MSGTTFLKAGTVALFLIGGMLAPCEAREPGDKEVEAVTTKVQLEEVSSSAGAPADVNGGALLEDRCTTCHGLKWIRQSRKSRDLWEQTIARMVRKGAWLNDDEKQALIGFLVETYGE